MLTSVPDLPVVTEFVRAANHRNYLRILFVQEDKGNAMCDFRIMVKKTSNQCSAVRKTRILESSLRQGVSRNPVVLTFLYLFIGITMWRF